MPWGSRGEVTKNGKIDSEYDFRLGIEMPEKLMSAIDSVLKFYNMDRIFQGENTVENDKEYKWFKEEFKMFVVPDLSNKQIY